MMTPEPQIVNESAIRHPISAWPPGQEPTVTFPCGLGVHAGAALLIVGTAMAVLFFSPTSAQKKRSFLNFLRS